MDDKTLQKKLNQLAKLANELVEEAKARYGEDGNLFFESDGYFHLMDGDSSAGAGERRQHIQFTSEPYCTMGAGAW